MTGACALFLLVLPMAAIGFVSGLAQVIFAAGYATSDGRRMFRSSMRANAVSASGLLQHF
jgi:hypothetical protein